MKKCDQVNLYWYVNLDWGVKDMQSPEVKCNVNECRYNEQSKICTAPSIQVTKHQTQATSHEATDCGTFMMR